MLYNVFSKILIPYDYIINKLINKLINLRVCYKYLIIASVVLTFEFINEILCLL